MQVSDKNRELRDSAGKLGLLRSGTGWSVSLGCPSFSLSRLHPLDCATANLDKLTCHRIDITVILFRRPSVRS